MPEQKTQMQENPAQDAPMPQSKEEKKKPSWILWVVLVVILLLIGGGIYYWFFYKEKQDTGDGADQTTPVSTEESTTEDGEEEETTDETEDETEEEASDPYEGWKTYTSPEKTFSFKYPSDYEVSGGPTDNFKVTTTKGGYEYEWYLGFMMGSAGGNTCSDDDYTKLYARGDDEYVRNTVATEYEYEDTKTASFTVLVRDKDTLKCGDHVGTIDIEREGSIALLQYRVTDTLSFDSDILETFDLITKSLTIVTGEKVE